MNSHRRKLNCDSQKIPRWIFSIIILGFLGLFTTNVSAQVNFTISGKILDRRGVAVPGATVTLTKTDLSVSPPAASIETTTTDSGGNYSFQTFRTHCSFKFGIKASTNKLFDGDPVQPSGESSMSGCINGDKPNENITWWDYPYRITVSGYARDLSGNPIPGAAILYRRNHGWLQSGLNTYKIVRTDGNGYYSSPEWAGKCNVSYNVRVFLNNNTLSGENTSSGCITSNVTLDASGGNNAARDIPSDWGGGSCPINRSGVSGGLSAVGEPVNVTNGNMYIQHSDYSLPGTGENIRVARTYNSQNQAIGLFGKGWTSDYDKSLLSMGNNILLLTLPDGRGIYLGNNGANVFTPATPDFYGKIILNNDGTYTLDYDDGRSRKFSSGGKLLWLKDRQGNQTTLAYGVGGNLTGITDPFGRSVGVTMSQGVITQLGDGLGVVADYAYNTDGTLQSVTYPDGSKYQFDYMIVNGTALIEAVRDALNNVLEAHLYDTAGRATTSEKHGGVEKYTLDYSAPGYTQVTDALGRVTKYYFDKTKAHNLVTKIEGNCNCTGGSQATEYLYDDSLNLVKKIDALGRETDYTYDADGNPLTVTDVLGTETFTYNNLGQVLTRTDRMNGVTTNTYDANGNLLTTTDPLNKTTTFTYNAQGQPLTVTDARNKMTSFGYDSAGRLAQITDANNKNTVYAYDARSRVTGVTNALSQTTNFEYDLNNRLKKVIHPDTNFVTYTYDLAGRRTGVTDERNNTTTYSYDNAYRLTGVTDALTHAKAFGYDLMSNLVSQTDALGNVTNYEFDEFDRLKKVIYPPATTNATRLEENLTYDLVGNLKTRTDTAGRVTTYNYDNANRLIETIDALSKVTQFYYNARSQTTKVKDALNQEYEFTYDPLGRVLSEARGSSTTIYEYDAVGNRTKRTDYKGQVTDYVFDNLNRLITITYQTQTPETFSYVYDDLSRLTSATNPVGTVSFTYDNRNRVTSTTDVHGKLINYAYDAAGNRTELKINNVAHSAYAYDAANRLTTLTDEANQNFTFGYDIADRLISKTLPNGIATTYNFDGMNRLTRLKDELNSTILGDRQYAYNAANQISQIAEPNVTRNFAYDLVDRLTQVTNPNNPSENYAYDAVGNRTSSHLSANYTHQAFNRLTNTAAASFVYDSNGNMAQKTDSTGTWAYYWDFENRLTQVINPNSQSVSYKYDALSRRVERTENTNVTKFTYDGLDVVLDDETASGITRYQNGLGIDNKLKLSDGTNAKYFLHDYLGSTTTLTDQTGNVLTSAAYDSFGNSVNTLGTRYQFTGREKDDFSGLTYYRARWYDSNLGRFVSEDPIGFEGGDVNLFGYVRSNPANAKDPSGTDIVVIENGPTEGNPFGHTAIGISGKGVFSFGNGNNGEGSNIINGGLNNYLLREAPRRRTALWVIKTSPEQDLLVEKLALEINKEEPLSRWRILFDNCSLRSNRLLDAAGIVSPSNFLPRFMPGDAGHRAFVAGGNFYVVPKGQNVNIQGGMFTPSYNFKDFEPR